MSFLASVATWLMSPTHWAGSDGIPTRIGEHLLLSGLATLIAVVVALPVGVFFGHSGRGGFFAVNVANLCRALPSIALLALALPVAFSLKLGLGFWPTFLALVPLGIPPVLTNSFVAVREVDRDVVEAARGMGFREDQVLRRVEVPVGLALFPARVGHEAGAGLAAA